jgi:hypothetical protein
MQIGNLDPILVSQQFWMQVQEVCGKVMLRGNHATAQSGVRRMLTCMDRQNLLQAITTAQHWQTKA